MWKWLKNAVIRMRYLMVWFEPRATKTCFLKPIAAGYPTTPALSWISLDDKPQKRGKGYFLVDWKGFINRPSILRDSYTGKTSKIDFFEDEGTSQQNLHSSGSLHRKKTRRSGLFFVRMKGLEPPRLSAPDPKSGAATNYATSAGCTKIQNYWVNTIKLHQ